MSDQQSPGVPGQPYTEETRSLAYHAAFNVLPCAHFQGDRRDGYGICIGCRVDAALDALAAAGRLIPPDRPARSCGCPLKYVAGVDVRHQDGCEVIEKRRREDAELRAWEKATGHTEDW
jgi:hypothetical protein